MKLHALPMAVIVGALLAACPTAARAQEAKSKPSKGESARKESAGGDVAKNAAAFGAMMAAMDSGAKSAEQIKAIESISSSALVAVNAKDVTAKGADADVAAAVERNKDGIEKLRAAVQANAVLRFMLGRMATPVAPPDVIAGSVDENGIVTIFYRKP